MLNHFTSLLRLITFVRNLRSVCPLLWSLPSLPFPLGSPLLALGRISCSVTDFGPPSSGTGRSVPPRDRRSVHYAACMIGSVPRPRPASTCEDAFSGARGTPTVWQANIWRLVKGLNGARCPCKRPTTCSTCASCYLMSHLIAWEMAWRVVVLGAMIVCGISSIIMTYSAFKHGSIQPMRTSCDAERHA